MDEEPEINKTEETAETTLPEKELNEIVGGACSGKHIKQVTIDMPPPPPPPPTN